MVSCLLDVQVESGRGGLDDVRSRLRGLVVGQRIVKATQKPPGLPVGGTPSRG